MMTTIKQKNNKIFMQNYERRTRIRGRTEDGEVVRRKIRRRDEEGKTK